ncbi:MAG: hypothetical protein KGL59_07705 [Acidobacteriota bacterium]|nr:hypothetical protein [Acidobacteriota bacterium]
MQREQLGQRDGARVVTALIFGFLASLALAGCGTAGGSASSGGTSPPPAPTTTVSVSPGTASLFPGQSQQFTATVSGNSNTNVSWSVNGVGGGNSAVGTITAGGLYTAPAVLPSSASITIAATSQADSAASGTASVTLASDIQVTISPATASVATGASQTFTAQVTGTGSPSTAVNWSLTGSACATGCGTLATNGNTATYTAPSTVPSTPTVSIVATSVADPSKSATATVTIIAAQTCTPSVSISPASASLALGAQQNFTATVCFSTNQNVTWSVTGSGCSGTNCGTVTSTGANTATYTAPGSLPPANPVTLVATSAADSTKSASASITITSSCASAISISPSAATVALGGQASFTASVCFTTDQSVSWAVTGSACTGTNCGTVSSTGPNTATYTAPTALPPSNPVALVATSLADATKSASASIDVVSAVAVTLSPLSAVVAVNRRVSLSASVQPTTNQAVTWTVGGITNGNTTLGEICLAGSNPCSPPSGAVSGAVDFLAPAAVPSPADVYVTATSAADTSRSATGEIGIVAHPSVELSPVNSVVAPSGTVEFAATVSATTNTSVNWQVSCASAACGSITSNGVYTAPGTAPTPNSITITATSQDDPTQSALATVALTSAAAISGISPASVTAGAANSFALASSGYDFVATSPGPGTTILVNGASRATTCASASACSVTIDPSDVSAAGTVTIQAQNPDGTLSNTLPLIVVPPDGPASPVSLSGSQPIGAMQDVTAVQPTTDGTTSGPITMLLFGLIDTSTNTCNVTESPITLAVPSSGSAAYSICLAGNGLDPSYNYAIAGSQSTDVTVSNPQAFAGSLVEITVTVSSTAAAGARTLVVTDPNNDRAVLSGAIDVE